MSHISVPGKSGGRGGGEGEGGGGEGGGEGDGGGGEGGGEGEGGGGEGGSGGGEGGGEGDGSHALPVASRWKPASHSQSQPRT